MSFTQIRVLEVIAFMVKTLMGVGCEIYNKYVRCMVGTMEYWNFYYHQFHYLFLCHQIHLSIIHSLQNTIRSKMQGYN